MMRLENVSAAYGRRTVLHEVNLSIEAGEMAGLLGPNGSGKTTLLLAAAGVLPLSGGRIYIDGRPLEELSARGVARRLASNPQRLGAAFDLNVLSVVLMGRYPYLRFLGGYDDEDLAIARASMRETGVDRFEDRLTGQLSGGEFQRVIIARTLTQKTPMILLDEAASGLDIARKIEIYDLLQEKHQQGTTILTAIHDLNLAALYCRRLIFIKGGRIVLDGPVDEVFTAENLEDIYETKIYVHPHPAAEAPQAHLAPGRLAGRAGHADGPGRP
jgi:iron complex transport system ATP-binding protein